jgi:hypothetical protein
MHSRAAMTKSLHQLLLSTEEVTLLAQALAVAAMDDLKGDTEALTPSRASRIVWACAHGPDSSPFRRALGPLATALSELVTDREGGFAALPNQGET